MTKAPLSLIWDRNDVYPWPWVFADEILTKEISAVSKGKKLSLVIHVCDDGHLFNYEDATELNRLATAIFRELIRKPDAYKAVIEKVYDLCEGLLFFSKRLARKKQGRIPTDELVADILRYVQELKRVRLYGWVPALIDGIGEPVMSSACLAALHDDLPNVSPPEINRYYSILITPREYSEIQRSEIDRYKLAITIGPRYLKKIFRSKNHDAIYRQLTNSLKRRVDSYCARYAWTSYNYEGPALHFYHLVRSLRSVTTKSAKTELARIDSHQKSNLKQQRVLYRTLRLTPYTRRLLSMASDLMLLKEYRKSIYQQSYVLLDPHLRELASRLGLTLRELKFLHPTEYPLAISHPSLYRTTAARRSRYCVVVIKNGLSHYFYGDEARKLARKLTKEYIASNVRELTGLVAFPGLARGVVRIIHSTRDLPKMHKGDVLVSGSTNPDLLPAMKKASALVTDIGGITSHAAIVSRELRTPCIVGAKVATKVLKDGDVVQIDAHKGIITVVS